MSIHWTEEHRTRLAGATSLQEAADVAVRVLEAMAKKDNRLIHQICGPITTGGLGCPDKNRARFSFAIARAEQTLLVFNQMPLQEAIARLTCHYDGGSYCTDILEVLYRRIFESGQVHMALFLPGWESSTGACWEHAFVQSQNILVRKYPSKWLPED